MSLLGDVVNVGTFGLVPDITGEKAIGEATAASLAGSREAIAEQRRQFDLTRSDLLPFLEAATGEGGALEQFIAGIDQAPVAPTLPEFTFDPQAALQDPSFQFIREQGDVAMQRAAAANRQLGSGNRLLAAQEFGQGLATTFLPQQFEQQKQLSQIESNRLLQEHSLGLQSFNDRLNRLGGLIDVGAGTGGTLGQLGAQSAATIGGLQQGIGQTQAAGIMGQQAGVNQLLSAGLTGAGFLMGGPAGGAATGGFTSGLQQPVPGFSPIGAQDAQGFFA